MGETKTLFAFAEGDRKKYHLLKNRVEVLGWDIEEAMERRVQLHKPKKRAPFVSMDSSKLNNYWRGW